ncbi:MAG: VUT family protein [Alphaproteobacteria bacterium]|nr:VUT family protein [Alphaproteobacteria bacterium]
MREYKTYPENEIVEVKKPKLYLLTSKVVNLFAVFVACISVSTFFATRYIGMGDVFFSANAFSTMLATALIIVILEIYGKKNATKAFMAGAYAILLIFFISAFIPDFNPKPIGYYESSFINYHQKILLCVFISYVISFLMCIKIYLYMKNELHVPYLWVKAAPAIAISQAVYTICYYLIYHGFNNLEYASLDITNELYLKFFILIACLLIISFIISGIKSGFFDLAKNIFPQNDNHHEDEHESHPIKQAHHEEEIEHHHGGGHGNQLAHASPLYLEDYSRPRSKRHLPDYSEDYYENDSHGDSHQGYDEGGHNEGATLSKRGHNRVMSRREAPIARSRSRGRYAAEMEAPSAHSGRSRTRGARHSGSHAVQQTAMPQFANQRVGGNLPMQQIGSIGGKPRFRAAGGLSHGTSKFGSNVRTATNSSQSSFFSNSLGQRNRNNSWNR